MYYVLSAKILVVGGWAKGVSKPPLEIIDFIDTKLKSNIVKDEDRSRGATTGGILQNQPLICGGFISNYKTTKNISVIGMPNHCFEMMIPR